MGREEVSRQSVLGMGSVTSLLEIAVARLRSQSYAYFGSFWMPYCVKPLGELRAKRGKLEITRMGEHSVHSAAVQSATAVRAVNLTKQHRSGGGHEVRVFSELNFEIAPGERVAIVGASGSGKSTLLHLLGGLDRPTTGTVFYGGQDLFAQSEAQLAAFRSRHVAFVWQMNSLLPEFSAVENVLMPLLIRGAAHADALKSAEEALAQVGLADRKTHKPGELSGGEQQRVALARALVVNPTLLLADEPTGNLDYQTAEAVAGLIAELNRTRGFTTVIVTHNQAFAQTCDRVLQLEMGGFRGMSSETGAGS